MDKKIEIENQYKSQNNQKKNSTSSIQPDTQTNKILNPEQNTNDKQSRASKLIKIIVAFWVGIYSSGMLLLLIYHLSVLHQSYRLIVSIIIALVVGPVVNFVLLKKFKINHFVQITVIESIIMLIIVGFVTYLVIEAINSISQQISSNIQPHNNNSSAVKAVYAQTADQAAKLILSDTQSPSLYTEQSLPIDPKSVETNEVKTLYCFTINSTPNVVSELIAGFSKGQMNGRWDYTSGAYGLKASSKVEATTLQNQFAQNGTIDLPFVTPYETTLLTSNPNYYPQASADVVISTPQQSGQCNGLAKQFNTTNKFIVSVSLDLSDYYAQF
jgi:hypothetical protein